MGLTGTECADPGRSSPVSDHYLLTGHPLGAMNRLLDVAGAAALLMLSAPVMLVAALVVKLSSPGPVFFAHWRCGKDHEPFKCFKFRTMVRDAEQWLESDEKLRQAHRRNGFKLATVWDPRVTPVGRFLRTTHLDELPQLWNVLRGEMSLVGPRPIVGEELKEYGERADELLSVRPGIFGEWTAMGSDRPPYPGRVEVELSYIEAPSVSRYLSVLCRNLPVLIQGQKASSSYDRFRAGTLDITGSVGRVGAGTVSNGGRTLTSIAESIILSLQKNRRDVAIGVYAGVAGVAYAFAFLIRFEFSVPAPYVLTLVITFPVLVAIRVAASQIFRLNTGRWRFVGTQDVVRLVGTTLVGTFAFWLTLLLVPFLPPVPRSILLLEWILTTSGTAGIWITYRVCFERLRQRGSRLTSDATRVLVVGAGEAGNLLAREILRFPTGYRLVGFVDDDPLKWGTTLHGVDVIGGTIELAMIVEEALAEEVIIATPSATPSQLRTIVTRCEEVNAPFKVLPGISEVLAGDVSVKQLRPLRIEDLLGREPVNLELPELEKDLEGRCVLITGAAGSIGSELARQVALHRPKKLILLDQAESDLYFLELELRKRHPELFLVPVIGNVLDEACVGTLFRSCHPERVFHAAAYKHVPMMEANVREAIRNNVLGTWKVARMAGEYGCEKFVLISTDKAVDPASVMGATKRVAELATMACHDRFGGTSFVAVRFGNVLGSNGSVIPVFQRQLEVGGPLTVTHPDVTRYFMTTSEAVQLVLQASVLKDAQGQVAMLDMGEPVRIVELAENLVRLSGLRVGSDVDIVFTGLRPGEKLHEQLAADHERTRATAVRKVRIVESSGASAAFCATWERMEALDPEIAAADGEDLRVLLSQLVGLPHSGLSQTVRARAV